jgi:hypothetical protein
MLLQRRLYRVAFPDAGDIDVLDRADCLRLRVDRNGIVEGTGYEPLNDDPTVSRRFHSFIS